MADRIFSGGSKGQALLRRPLPFGSVDVRLHRSPFPASLELHGNTINRRDRLVLGRVG